jgi:hypothetical protein
MKKFFNLKQLLVVVCIMLCGNALALGRVSRACNFYNIPYGLKNTAAIFFVEVVGAQPWVLELPGYSDEDQQDYWILESLTTDYIRTRYYLYAQSTAYYITGVSYINAYEEILYLKQWSNYSTPWTAETVPEAIKNDPRFSQFWANRRYLFSARAGNPAIVMKITGAHGGGKFLVKGRHSYYDPAGKITVDYGETEAFSCNLSNVGMGFFDR